MNQPSWQVIKGGIIIIDMSGCNMHIVVRRLDNIGFIYSYCFSLGVVWADLVFDVSELECELQLKQVNSCYLREERTHQQSLFHSVFSFNRRTSHCLFLILSKAVRNCYVLPLCWWFLVSNEQEIFFKNCPLFLSCCTKRYCPPNLKIFEWTIFNMYYNSIKYHKTIFNDRNWWYKKSIYWWLQKLCPSFINILAGTFNNMSSVAKHPQSVKIELTLWKGDSC